MNPIHAKGYLKPNFIQTVVSTSGSGKINVYKSKGNDGMDYLLFIVACTYNVIKLLLAIYAGEVYQLDGHTILEIIFLLFPLDKGRYQKNFGNWVPLLFCDIDFLIGGLNPRICKIVGFQRTKLSF